MYIKTIPMQKLSKRIMIMDLIREIKQMIISHLSGTISNLVFLLKVEKLSATVTPAREQLTNLIRLSKRGL